MVSNAHIVLDTNILNFILSNESELRKKTENLITQLVNNKNTLYISEFTHYELLRGATNSKINKCKDLLAYFKTIPHSSERLKRATKLYTFYQNAPSVKRMMHGISDVDLFIGSLIFTNKEPYLLTTDYTDFPRPFFREGDCYQIDFKTKKKKNKKLDYNLLQADLSKFI